MCLANDYFTQFESTEVMNDPQYKEWIQLFSELPDDLLKLGAYLDACSPEKWDQIHKLSEKFKSVLTEDEIKGLAAHELGHAKHLHGLRHIVALALLIPAAFKIDQFVQSALGSNSILATLGIVYGLIHIGFYQVSKYSEQQADEECRAALSYTIGIKDFFKKFVIQKLTKGKVGSASANVRGMLERDDLLSTHPHPAKRVQMAVERMQNQRTFAPLPVSSFNKVIAATGVAILVYRVTSAILAIWPHQKQASNKK